MSALHILYEDNHCLAVAKPAGLLTQAPAGVPSLEALVREYLKETHGKAGRIYLGVPHRLDRPVSGVVLFARQTKSARRLAEQFEKRQVTKLYWGALEGEVSPAEGVWEDWLRKVPEQPRGEVVAADAPGARPARLRYRCLGRFAGGTMLEFQPETGRMHQIRLQAAARGHPVLGDALYGAVGGFGPTVENDRDRMIALHARALTCLHPIRFEPITLTAPLPEAWQGLDVNPPLATSPTGGA